MENKKLLLVMSVMVLIMVTMSDNAYGQSIPTQTLVGKWIHESGVIHNKPESIELFRN